MGLRHGGVRVGSVALALTIVALGTHLAPAGAATVRQSITVDGASRSFVLHRGSSAPASGAPLVVALHGAGGSGAGMESLTGFDGLADQAGFLVAYPDAGKKNWETGCCDAAAQAVDDLDFMSALVQQLVAQERIDAARVYFVGFSAGGYFAYRVACQRTSLVAGMGSVAGSEQVRGCQPPQPVTVVEIHGTDDVYDEGCGKPTYPCDSSNRVWRPAVEDLNRAWRQRDICPNPDNPPSTTNGQITTFTANGCSAGSSVVLVKEQSRNTDPSVDRSHCWPGASGCQYTYNATSLLWSTLSPHRAAPGATRVVDTDNTHSAPATTTPPRPPTTARPTPSTAGAPPATGPAPAAGHATTTVPGGSSTTLTASTSSGAGSSTVPGSHATPAPSTDAAGKIRSSSENGHGPLIAALVASVAALGAGAAVALRRRGRRPQPPSAQ